MQKNLQVPSCNEALALVKASDVYTRFPLIRAARLHRCTSLSVRPDGTVVYSIEIVDPSGGLYSMIFAIARTLDRLDASVPLNVQRVGQLPAQQRQGDPVAVAQQQQPAAQVKKTAQPKQPQGKKTEKFLQGVASPARSAAHPALDKKHESGWDGLAAPGGIASTAAPWLCPPSTPH